MEDDKIKDLFAGFDPVLSPSGDFMNRLKRNMEVLESVRRKSCADKRHFIPAVAIAALCGFIAGVAMTLLYPLICEGVWAAQTMIPWPAMISTVNTNTLLSWALIAGVCIITSVNAYELAMARLSARAES